jgi:sugar lactone lactonase YvrE
VWSPRDGRLYWFDIKGLRLAWYEPATDDRGAFSLPVRASAAAPRAAGGLILATEKGLAVCNPVAETVEIVAPFELDPGFRTNDGKIDTKGNFWWSIMDDDGGKRPGSVFRTGPDLKTERMFTGIHIPNTISMSPNGKRLYLVDSQLQTIFVHDTADYSKVQRFPTRRAGRPRPTARRWTPRATFGTPSGAAGGSYATPPTGGSSAPSSCRCRNPPAVRSVGPT